MKLFELIEKLERGCDCGYDYRCPNCQAVLDVKQEAAEIKDSLLQVIGCAQGLLTALNVGNIESGSPLHLDLRKRMIDYRNSLGAPGSECWLVKRGQTWFTGTGWDSSAFKAHRYESRGAAIADISRWESGVLIKCLYLGEAIMTL